MSSLVKLGEAQSTIRYAVSAKGVGLHSGRMIKMTLYPAKPDTGVIFRRVDCNPKVIVPANMAYVTDTRLCTTIEKNGFKVATVEHFLSAVRGLGIDNVIVDIDGAEVPIMDGSAEPFVFLLLAARIVKQNVPRRYLVIKEPIEVVDDKSTCRLLPYDGFKVMLSIDFKHPSFNKENQKAYLDFSKDSYVVNISRARTFGFVDEMKYLQKNNLALGASLSNAIGLDREKVVNPEGLRYKDEFAKHKVLDAVGDLSLLGMHICGSFEGYCTGHRMNKILLDKLMTNKSSWELVN